MRRITTEGIELVKSFEGLRLQAYQCPSGIWTIGYGHTNAVVEGSEITEEHAEELLKIDIRVAEKAVEAYITFPLTDNQFSALVSFTFNVGFGSLRDSTLRRKLNQGDYDSVPGQLARWVKSKGRVLNGLVRRRSVETNLFLTPDRELDELPMMPQSVDAPHAAKPSNPIISWMAALWRVILKLVGSKEI